MEEARAIDERLASGGKPRPLEGVPFLIKDILQTKGVRTTFGSLLLENDVPDEDTISVERLKTAEGYIIGQDKYSRVCPRYQYIEQNIWNY